MSINLRIGMLVLTGAMLASGCGGRLDSHYTASSTVNCLNDRPGVHDLNTSRQHLDFVASAALEGAFGMELDSGNSVTVIFDRSVEDAEAYAAAYESFARGLSSVEYIPRRRANATTLWKKNPSAAETGLLEECLSEGGAAIPLHEQDPSLAKSYRYGSRKYAAYLDQCSQAGFARSTCRCLLEWAQARYPEDTFGEALSRRGLLKAVIESCR